ncbi:hypothetical protein [Treponema putidum]
MKKKSNTRFNLTFVLSRKLRKVPIQHRNFRANFAAAMRIGKGANAG